MITNFCIFDIRNRSVCDKQMLIFLTGSADDDDDDGIVSDDPLQNSDKRSSSPDSGTLYLLNYFLFFLVG